MVDSPWLPQRYAVSFSCGRLCPFARYFARYVRPANRWREIAPTADRPEVI